MGTYWTSSKGVKTSLVLSSAARSRCGCVWSTTNTTRTMSPPRRRHQGLPHTLRAPGSSASGTTVSRKRKRESVSSSNVLASSDVEDDVNDAVLTGCTNNIGAHNNELDEYLALPHIMKTTESGIVSNGA